MSTPTDWTGADIVFLDCDSTMSRIEGIDELALRAGIDVAALTSRAMSGELPLHQVYRERLQLIKPGAEDFAWLAALYGETALPGVAETIAAIQGLGIRVCVISGGLLPSVQPFAVAMGVSSEDVFAVPYPLESAHPLEIACAHPLAANGGKPKVIAEVCARLNIKRSRRLLVGDGAVDLEASSELGLFAGFGAVQVRPQVESEAAVFLRGPGLWAVALHAAGSGRLQELGECSPMVYEYAVSEAQTIL